MQNVWKITKKDLRLLVRDRLAVIVLIALPLAFIAILGMSAGQLFNEKEKARRMKLGVVNEDTSELSVKLIGEVVDLDVLTVNELTDRQVAKDMLADGKIDVLVFIGPHYHERVENLELGDVLYAEEGKLAQGPSSLDVEVYAGAFLANAAEIVNELVLAFAVRTIAPDVLRAKEPKLATKLFLKVKREMREAYPEGAPKVRLVSTKARGDIIYQYLVPSYTVMFVFFIVNFMANSLIGERNTGTLNRLLIAPISRMQLMLGKTIPFLTISIVQTVLLFLAGKVLFQMSWGEHPWMLIPIMIATSVAATAMGLLLATIVRTDSQVSAYGTFLVLILAGISGCLMPRSWQPELMQQVGLITPQAWALVAYDQLLSRDETNLHVVWNCAATLLGFAAVFYAVAWWRFRTLD